MKARFLSVRKNMEKEEIKINLMVLNWDWNKHTAFDMEKNKCKSVYVHR